MNDKEYKYFAFISYTRKDEKWAKWLQYKLEHYNFPVKIGKDPAIPKRIRPIFKDTSELSGGVLSEKLHEALIDSRYLIVICSPQAAKSTWVDKEIETFVDLGRSKRIIPFIVSGVPSSYNEEINCFPPTLLNMPKEQELLGVNINEQGRDAAAIKVIAYMFNLAFDTLWQRHEKEKRKKHFYIYAAILLFTIAAIYLALFYREQNQQLLISQSRFIAEKAEGLIVLNEDEKAIRLLLNVLPKNIEKPDRPYIEAAELALRKANESMRLLYILKHDKSVYSASLSPDGKYIVTASDDNTAKIWNAQTGEQVGMTMKHEEEVNSASFSNDGKNIVTTSWDCTAKIWNAETGEQVGKTMEHDNIVNSASFSPDGKYIVTASYDNTAKIWSAKTGEQVGVIMKHKNIVNSASFSPDGKYIVTASSDNTAKITEFIPLQELLDRYNKLFEEWPLTEEELKEYNFK